MVRESYDFVAVEKEYRLDLGVPGNEKMYVLGMFPYPSGQLHMGHLRNYTITDVVARLHRALGYNVMHPIGWDAFGLPAENAARDSATDPSIWTHANIASMTDELKAVSISYDWDKAFATCDPDYYVHEQRFFLQLMKDGIAYKKKSWVNWDPIDQTVLANEQVIDGRGWRSGALVEKRELSQWFLRISDYAEELLTALDEMPHWPDSVKNMQREWIGRSEGCEIDFSTDFDDASLRIFTTRPETVFGASFCAISAGHVLAKRWAMNNKDLAVFIEHNERIRYLEPDAFFTGYHALHPFIKGVKLPIYVANFVLSDYATGAIFGCPAHDARDNAIAKRFGLPINVVVSSESPLKYSMTDEMVNSDFLDGMTAKEARSAMISFVSERGLGCTKTVYKLKDWGVSRQRYWGCPIPVVYCPNCGQLPAADLPVVLPKDADFSLSGNPLDHHPTWKHVSCPECGIPATRETDTFDTFMESSWYFLGFCSSSHAMDQGGDWLPVDYYVGGIEHAILHLLYARYYTRLLHKYGYVKVKEPFHRLITQGMVCHKTYQTTEGKWLNPAEAKGRDDVVVGPSVKMSKSKKNTVSPASVVKSHGADAARLFILSDSPIDKQLEWTERGLDGALRFLKKLWDFVLDAPNIPIDSSKPSMMIAQKTNTMVERVTEAIKDMFYNVCIARMREFFNFLADIKSVNSMQEKAELIVAIETLLRVLEPFVPNIAQALWVRIGRQSIAQVPWPQYQQVIIDKVLIAIQVSGVYRSSIEVPLDSTEAFVTDVALQEPKIINKIGDKSVKRVIFIPNRAINFVL